MFSHVDPVTSVTDRKTDGLTEQDSIWVAPDLIFFSNPAGVRFGRICIFKSGRGPGAGLDFTETTT